MCSLRTLHYADAIPDPFGGCTTALTLEQLLVNVDPWYARREARAGVRPARLGTGRAEQALSHAREAHAIAATRYRNHLAPMTELLAAEAAETAAATRLEAARYMVVAEGTYRLAAGLELREEL